MRISDYLEVNKISLTTFAKACEIPPTTMIGWIKNESEPTVTNALKVIQTSHGAIKLEDLRKEK